MDGTYKENGLLQTVCVHCDKWMFYFKLLFQAQSFIVTLFSIVYINNTQTVYKIQCGLEDCVSLRLDMNKLNLKLIVRLASIISRSEVVVQSFPFVFVASSMNNIFVLNTKIILVW